MNDQKVSFLIGVYNESSRIRDCLDSVKQQTYPNIEIVIADDGSTDDTVEVIKNYIKENNDLDIKLVENEENIGLTKSLNKGIEHCSGKYIARLDADNVCLPERVGKQVDFLEKNNDFALVGSFNNKKFTDGREDINKFEVSPEKIKKNLIHSCQMTHSSIMVRADILKEYRYNEKYKTSQDYELYVRLAQKWKIGAIPEPLVVSEVRSDSISGKKSKWERFKRYTAIRWRAYRGLGHPWWHIIYVFKGLYDLLLPRFLTSHINKLRSHE